MAMRTNLFTNPNFTNDASGYGLDADYTWSATGGNFSPGCVVQASTTGFLNFTTVNDGTVYTVTPSTTYTFSVWANVTVNSGNPPKLCIVPGSPFNTPYSTLDMTATAGAFRQFAITFTTGGADTGVTMRIFNNNSSINATYDGFLLEQWGAAQAFFDGSSTAPRKTYAWNGTANASTSTETQLSEFGNYGSYLEVGSGMSRSEVAN